MTTFTSFSAAALAWQSFYLLAGTAAATLVGLMFVAVTFGSGLVTDESSAIARAFLDPTFNHFVQILFTACLVTIPTMGARLFGVLLLTVGTYRFGAVFWVCRRMRHAQRIHGDMELSDWLMGVALPLLCHLALGLTGIAFLAQYGLAFNALAGVTLAVMLLGVFGAWELLVWMAIVRSRAK